MTPRANSLSPSKNYALNYDPFMTNPPNPDEHEKYIFRKNIVFTDEAYLLNWVIEQFLWNQFKVYLPFYSKARGKNKAKIAYDVWKYTVSFRKENNARPFTADVRLLENKSVAYHFGPDKRNYIKVSKKIDSFEIYMICIPTFSNNFKLTLNRIIEPLGYQALDWDIYQPFFNRVFTLKHFVKK